MRNTARRANFHTVKLYSADSRPTGKLKENMATGKLKENKDREDVGMASWVLFFLFFLSFYVLFSSYS